MTRSARPWWQANAFADRRPRLHARAAIARSVREWFHRADFIEIDTPALQVSPGLEPHLTAFATELREPFGTGNRRLYLHTSPEYAMKKVLAAGEPRIFQMAHVFRNEARSPTHHPEFTMLEWYRAGAGWRDLIDDTEALVRAALAAVPAFLSDRALRWAGGRADPSGPFERLSVAEAFSRYAGIDLLATAPDPSQPDARSLADAARKSGYALPATDTWEDMFFRLLLDRIEPHLGQGRPTVLHSYPASLAALARLDAADRRVAERFEIYVCGLELANGFGELTDPALQRRRFEDDVAAKRRLGSEVYPIDEDFLAALATMPAAAGIALGFDRLVMLATGATEIDEVLWTLVESGTG